jgi:hypothetical protein
MNVYISHPNSRYALAAVHDLRRALEGQGHHVLPPNSASPNLDLSEGPLAASDCLIALVTNERPSVLFEIGYGIGAGKPTLLLTPVGVELPADFRHLPLVVFGADFAPALSRVIDWVQRLQADSRYTARRPADPDAMMASYTENPAAFERISPRAFADGVFALFKEIGYEPSERQEEPEEGYDFAIQGLDGSGRTLVEVKKYNTGSKVPIDVVQQLLGIVYATKADGGLIVSATGFTPSACAFARRCGARMELWDIEELQKRVHAARTA